MTLRLDIAERGGDQVAAAENVTLAVGERTLIERFSGRVMRGRPTRHHRSERSWKVDAVAYARWRAVTRCR
jgi:hypothetical protein